MTTAAPPEVGTVLAPRAASGSDVFALIDKAIEHGMTVEVLERLQALHERVSDRAAAVEFAEAMAAFQSQCPPITKLSTGKIATKSGTTYTYKYAELDHIARSIGPILRGVGLSYSWDSATERDTLTCTCTLRHVNGHQVTSKFSCPVANPSGASDQQKHAMALTYAKRQALVQVLGLTTTDPDHDGGSGALVTSEQVMALEALLQECGVGLARVLKAAKVEALAEIPAADYDRLCQAIRAKASGR